MKWNDMGRSSNIEDRRGGGGVGRMGMGIGGTAVLLVLSLLFGRNLFEDVGTAPTVDASNGQLVFTLEGHTDGVNDAAFSPDGQVIIEQYWKDKGEYDRVYEYWALDAKHEHSALLNRNQYPDDARYPAGFRFTPNSQWLVRMQKTGSGSQDLFLYRRNGFEFSSATKKPLS